MELVLFPLIFYFLVYVRTLGDDEMRLKLQPVVVNCIEDLSRVVNNILATYPEVSSTCIKSSLATLTESSKCKY